MNLIITILLALGAVIGLAFSATRGRFIAFLIIVLAAGIAAGIQAELVAAGLVGWYEFVAFQVGYVKEKQKNGKTK